MNTVTYWFSPLSPFTYLAGDRLEQTGAEIYYRPFNIGPVFGATGGVPVPQRSPQRQAYRLQELERLSVRHGLPINLQPAHFPVDSTLACQWLITLRENGVNMGAASRAVLAAVWAQDLDISSADTLRQIATQCDLAPETVDAARATPDLVAQETQAAIDAGVFGSPFYQIKEQVFWGQENIEHLSAFLNE
ncbi:MAG: 2-hydroxychromene-2-carboxylate isomerase [Litorivicinus sp.]